MINMLLMSGTHIIAWFMNISYDTAITQDTFHDLSVLGCNYTRYISSFVYVRLQLPQIYFIICLCLSTSPHQLHVMAVNVLFNCQKSKDKTSSFISSKLGAFSNCESCIQVVNSTISERFCKFEGFI